MYLGPGGSRIRFTDRVDAGQRLAERLSPLHGQDVVVLALPRGGVPVADQVARALGAPLDIVVVRKLGVPYQPELAMGAVGEGGVRVLNDDVVRAARISAAELAAVERAERDELERRAQLFRGGRPPMPLAGRVAVVVDDGIATGATVRVACQVARVRGAARVVLAVPVAAPAALARLRGEADEIVCLEQPASLASVGQWYQDFSQTADQEVVAILERATAQSRLAEAGPDHPLAAPPAGDPPSPR